MTRTIEAVYSNGVLTLCEPLPLDDQQRVEVTVRSIDPAGTGSQSREEAVKRMVEGFDKMRLRINGKLPTREQLHERD